jgi:hypothetical protein
MVTSAVNTGPSALRGTAWAELAREENEMMVASGDCSRKNSTAR